MLERYKREWSPLAGKGACVGDWGRSAAGVPDQQTQRAHLCLNIEADQAVMSELEHAFPLQRRRAAPLDRAEEKGRKLHRRSMKSVEREEARKGSASAKQKPNDCGLEGDDETPSAACVNHWTLTAQLVEVAALVVQPRRYPAIDCVLEHQSDVVEAGLFAQGAKSGLAAVAWDPVQNSWSRQTIGCPGPV